MSCLRSVRCLLELWYAALTLIVESGLIDANAANKLWMLSATKAIWYGWEFTLHQCFPEAIYGQPKYINWSIQIDGLVTFNFDQI